MRGIVLFCIAAYVLLAETEAAPDRTGVNPYSTTRCRSASRNVNEECDTLTNCRYGGKCRKFADFSRGGTTVRVIVPLELDWDDSKETASRGPTIHQRLQNHGKRVCVCDFKCKQSDDSESRDVCGSDGNTYASECHLRRDACRCQMHLHVQRQGSCETEIVPVVINIDTISEEMRHKPRSCEKTCSYGGTCDEAGICICDIECSGQIVLKICGKDGKTYTNACSVKQAQCRRQEGIDIVHAGQCRRDEQRRQERPRLCSNLDCDAQVEDPLCGTDDISYPNECVLKHASCVKGKRIKVKHKRFCRKQLESSDATLSTSFPRPNPTLVSDALAIDKDDPCHGILCRYGAVCIKHMEFEFICSCEDICDRDRPIPTKPPTTGPDIISLDREQGVKSEWAEDNTEGWNGGVRIRRRNNRRSRRRHRRRRHRSKRTVEGPRPLIYEALCGTDGKTYENECFMKIEVCHQQREIRIAHRGACPKELPQNLVPNTSSSSSSSLFGNASLLSNVEVVNATSKNDEMMDSDQNRNHRYNGEDVRNKKQRNQSKKSRESKRKDSKVNSHGEDFIVDLQNERIRLDNVSGLANVSAISDNKGLLYVETTDNGPRPESSDSAYASRKSLVDEQKTGSNTSSHLSSSENFSSPFSRRTDDSSEDLAKQRISIKSQHRDQVIRSQFMNSDQKAPQEIKNGSVDFPSPIEVDITTSKTQLQDEIVLSDLKVGVDVLGRNTGSDYHLMQDLLPERTTSKLHLTETTVVPMWIDVNKNGTIAMQNLMKSAKDKPGKQSFLKSVISTNISSTSSYQKKFSLNSTVKQKSKNMSFHNILKLLNYNKATESWTSKIRNETTNQRDDDSYEIAIEESNNTGINVALLAVVIVIGQIIIVASFVAIFVYMKKRKKLKGLPDQAKPTEKIDTENTKPT